MAHWQSNELLWWILTPNGHSNSRTSLENGCWWTLATFKFGIFLFFGWIFQTLDWIFLDKSKIITVFYCRNGNLSDRAVYSSLLKFPTFLDQYKLIFLRLTKSINVMTCLSQGRSIVCLWEDVSSVRMQIVLVFHTFKYSLKLKHIVRLKRWI
jgi:cellulose synthase/poly-beta-1,6-N-acetylglucosamine synthase-like glycosyltransferase